MKKTLALKELALFAFSVAINEGVETEGKDVAILGVADVSTLGVAVVPTVEMTDVSTLGMVDALAVAETCKDSSLELVK
jgi:hypothetical protein